MSKFILFTEISGAVISTFKGIKKLHDIDMSKFILFTLIGGAVISTFIGIKKLHDIKNINLK
jgi:hypothetical protein